MLWQAGNEAKQQMPDIARKLLPDLAELTAELETARKAASEGGTAAASRSAAAEIEQAKLKGEVPEKQKTVDYKRKGWVIAIEALRGCEGELLKQGAIEEAARSAACSLVVPGPA